jgi:hypothetical protein
LIFGRYPICAASDYALCYSSLAYGFKVLRLEELKIIQLRETNIRQNIVKSRAIKNYALQYPFFYNLIFGFKYITSVIKFYEYYLTFFRLYLGIFKISRLSNKYTSVITYIRKHKYEGISEKIRNLIRC